MIFSVDAAPGTLSRFREILDPSFSEEGRLSFLASLGALTYAIFWRRRVAGRLGFWPFKRRVNKQKSRKVCGPLQTPEPTDIS